MEKRESLDKIVEHLEEEARMVLPGIQALFGFQLIAVFSQRFSDLEQTVQKLHFASLFLTAAAVLLVLTPAAYHRQAEPDRISETLCSLGSKFLTLSMLPLAAAISLDIYVLSTLISGISKNLQMGLPVLMFISFLSFWFVFPQFKRKRKFFTPTSQQE
jgi:hypothetical protein